MTPEGRVKKAVKAYLQEKGAHFYMPMKTSAYGKKDVDFLCCVDGWFVAIETKRSGSAGPTPLQRIHLERWANAGGLAFWADNIETVKKHIGALPK